MRAFIRLPLSFLALQLAYSGIAWACSCGMDPFLEDPAALHAAGAPQAELDPPPGPRRSWLDRTLDQHAFTVVLFYRGFW